MTNSLFLIRVTEIGSFVLKKLYILQKFYVIKIWESKANIFETFQLNLKHNYNILYNWHNLAWIMIKYYTTHHLVYYYFYTNYVKLHYINHDIYIKWLTETLWQVEIDMIVLADCNFVV